MRRNRDGERKLYNPFGLFSLVFLLFGASLSGQSFKDFKTTQARAFSNYKDERDAAFASYLKKQWSEYDALISKPLYEEAKPSKINPAIPKSIKSLGPQTRIVLKTPPEEPLAQLPIEPKIEKKDIYFDFFGTRLGFDVPKSATIAKFYPQNQEGVSGFFNVVASSEYQELVRSIARTKGEMALNDWGAYLLVNALSEKIFSNPDEAKLLSWFLLNKLGYDVKVGLAKKHVVLMHYSEKIIYSTPSYSFGKRKFYALSQYAKGSVGRLYTYERSYPNATKALDLQLKKLPNFEKNLKSKTLTFKQDGKAYSTTYDYNQNLLDFMATYPQADYDTFFNAPLEEATYRAIAQDMKKYIDGKKASQAMNFVLNFVQNAFAYQVDEEQFGREKVMFAEETLYYDKSDCEDRAILFSYLIKELFHIGVIGVKYKDHMSTALFVPMDGDSVRDGRKKYVVADPTYINANIGASMPKYKSLRPESFIHVEN